MKEDTKGLYLAIILSLVIIFVTNMIFPSSPNPGCQPRGRSSPRGGNGAAPTAG